MCHNTWLTLLKIMTCCLNQCWFIVDRDLLNKRRRNFNTSRILLFGVNSSENLLWKMGTILIRPGALLQTWINVDPSMESNYLPGKMWEVITYPFLNVNGATLEVWELICDLISHFNCIDKYFHPTFYNGCNYLFVLGIKSNYVCKRGHCVR